MSGIEDTEDGTLTHEEIIEITETEGREETIPAQNEQDLHTDEAAENSQNVQRNWSNVPSKKRKTTTEKILDTIWKRTEQRNDFLKQLETRKNTDKPHPIKMFFESMAETMMTFSPALAIRAKKEHWK